MVLKDKWYGIKYFNGAVIVKRYVGDEDMGDAAASPKILDVTEMFFAPTKELAYAKAKKLLS